MPQMTDPMNALRSMQDCLSNGMPLPLARCTIHKDMEVLFDSPTGEPRITFVLLAGETVKALCMYAHAEPIDDIPCFDIGYAVAENFRRHGLGQKVLENSLEELCRGFKGEGRKLYFEAVIGTGNTGSQKIAARVLSPKPKAIVDHISGQDALLYRKLVVL